MRVLLACDSGPEGEEAVTQRGGCVPEETQSCRSEEGITVGLVDALIGIMRVLAPRDLRPTSVQEALADLLEDSDFRTVQDARTAEPLGQGEWS